VIRASFCLRDPAAALRGLAKGRVPASVNATFNSSKAFTGRYTSPRTSITDGGSSTPSVRGIVLRVRTFAVMSSPIRPSPRVAATVSTPPS